MHTDIHVEGEGLADVEIVRLARGSTVREVVAAITAKTGLPSEGAFVLIEDGDEPLDLQAVLDHERAGRVIHHVHRARQIEVAVHYGARTEHRSFPPSTRVQRVLTWAVGSDGFKIDPVIVPEMELALHGTTTALPRQAHIGRFVRHPAKRLELDLIRGVVPNGSY